MEHQQYWATHTSRVHATTKRNRKFENNNVTLVMSRTAPRDRRPRPLNRNNGDDRHRRPSSHRDRRQRQQRHQRHQRHQCHRRYQQKIIIWRNIIIETWAKLFGGGYTASIRKNERVSMDSDKGGVCVCLFRCGYVLCHAEQRSTIKWRNHSIDAVRCAGPTKKNPEK